MIWKRKDREELEPDFRGWGCYGINKEGKRTDLEMSNWGNLEEMVESAYSNKEIISLEIFKCFNRKEWKAEPVSVPHMVSNTHKED